MNCALFWQHARTYCLNIVNSIFFPCNVMTLGHFFPKKSLCIYYAGLFLFVAKMRKLATNRNTGGSK